MKIRIGETKIGNKTMKKLKKIQKKKEIRKKSEKIKTTIKEQEYLNKIGQDLANKFTITELIAASKGKGYDVHGYLQQNYSYNDDEGFEYINYDLLIDKMILDRAVFFSKKANVPEIIKFTDRVNIEEFYRTVIVCNTPLILKNMPNMHIKKILLYSDKPFSSAISWIDNFDWMLDGYDVKINMGPANIGMIGYLVNEILICVLLHAPGQNQGLADVVFDTKGTLTELNDLVKRYVYEYRQKEKNSDELMEEKDMEVRLAEKMYSDLKKKNLTHYIGSERDFKNFEEDLSGRKRTKKHIKRRKIIFGVITTLLVCAAFYGLILVMGV